MPKRIYVTVAVELTEHADAAADHFESLGYTVKIEHGDVSFPNAPTLHCRRQLTTMAVEVDTAIRLPRLEEWVRYCKSCTKDMRVALVVPSEPQRKPAEEDRLRELGIGLFVAGPNGVVEVAPPKDLAVNVELPDRAGLPRKLRKALGPVYEQFDRSQWREGFESACTALEQEARRYLRSGIERSAVVLVTAKGNVRRVTVEAVDKMTLGQLAVAFSEIQNKSFKEQRIGEVLAQVNKDRVGVAHHKGKALPEVRLRKNVGKHMWAVVTALKLLKNA